MLLFLVLVYKSFCNTVWIYGHANKAIVVVVNKRGNVKYCQLWSFLFIVLVVDLLYFLRLNFRLVFSVFYFQFSFPLQSVPECRHQKSNPRWCFQDLIWKLYLFTSSNQLKSQSNQDQNVFEMDQTLRGFNWGEIPFTFLFWRRNMPLWPQPQWVSLKRTNEGSSPIWRSHIFGDLETFLRNSRRCGSGTIRAQGIVVVREWKKKLGWAVSVPYVLSRWRRLGGEVYTAM